MILHFCENDHNIATAKHHYPLLLVERVREDKLKSIEASVHRPRQRLTLVIYDVSVSVQKVSLGPNSELLK